MMTPAARRRRAKPKRRLTYVAQIRFTPEQAAELESILDQADDPAFTFSSLVRNIVGVWLINQRGLKGQALEDAVAELHQLAQEDDE